MSGLGRLPWREAGLARQSLGLPAFLRAPHADVAAASDRVRERVRRRDAAFVETAERLIYGVPASPLRRLLLWAGCEAGDLRRLVATDGLEGALARLHAAGVRVSAEELRGRTPLRRSGLELALAPRDLANPAAPGAVAGASSGTSEQDRGGRGAGAGRSAGDNRAMAGGRSHGGGDAAPGGAVPGGTAAGGRGVPVSYSWDFLAAEAEHELLLLASHGLVEAPLALWLPGPPGIAGLHNLLAHAKLGRPPDRWFSPSPPPAAGEGLACWADRGWRAARRLLPALGPAPEWVPAERAAEVARWLAVAPRPALLKCFAGAAVRVGRAALAAGLDVAGKVVFAGGEPLGAARERFLAGAGLRAFARYATTETGFLAGACPLGESGGDMHLYADRAALIAAGPGAGLGGVPGGGPDGGPGALAVTTLSAAAPLVLLNAELGDHGTLRRAACGCALGRAGLEWRVADVHSPGKVTAEGIKLGEVDFAQLVEAAVRSLGGGPDDFQIWVAGDDGFAVAPGADEEAGPGAIGPGAIEPGAIDGAGGERGPGSISTTETAASDSRLAIVLAPDSAVAPAALCARLRQDLPRLSGGALAARLWLDGGGLQVLRRPFVPGAGHKLRRVVRLPPAQGRDAGEA